MNNPILFWNSPYQISKSPFSIYTSCVGTRITNFQKNQTFIACCCRCGRYTCLQCCQAATDFCHVSLGSMGSCWTQASFLDRARGLYHSDVITSLAHPAEQCWHSKQNVIYDDSMGPNTSRVSHIDWKHGYQTQQVSLCPLFNTIRAIALI